MKRLFTLMLSILLASTAYCQLPAGDMEHWHSYTVDGTQLTAPLGWYGSDSAVFAYNELFPLLMLTPEKQIFRSGNMHGGDSAARVETKDIGSIFGLVGGSLSNAKITLSQTGLAFVGGSNVSEHISFVNAWVRYTSGAGNDSGSMTVTAIAQGSNGDSIIGGGTVTIGEASSYMYVSAMVSYDMSITPSKIQITFNSSGVTPEDGSILWVDDVTISTLSVKDKLPGGDIVKYFPNPSSGIISIYNPLNELLAMEVFNISGQKVATKQFKGNDILDLSTASSGTYLYKVSDRKGSEIQHGKLNVLK